MKVTGSNSLSHFSTDTQQELHTRFGKSTVEWIIMSPQDLVFMNATMCFAKNMRGLPQPIPFLTLKAQTDDIFRIMTTKYSFLSHNIFRDVVKKFSYLFGQSFPMSACTGAVISAASGKPNSVSAYKLRSFCKDLQEWSMVVRGKMNEKEVNLRYHIFHLASATCKLKNSGKNTQKEQVYYEVLLDLFNSKINELNDAVDWTNDCLAFFECGINLARIQSGRAELQEWLSSIASLKSPSQHQPRIRNLDAKPLQLSSTRRSLMDSQFRIKCNVRVGLMSLEDKDATMAKMFYVHALQDLPSHTELLPLERTLQRFFSSIAQAYSVHTASADRGFLKAHLLSMKFAIVHRVTENRDEEFVREEVQGYLDDNNTIYENCRDSQQRFRCEILHDLFSSKMVELDQVVRQANTFLTSINNGIKALDELIV